MTTEPSSSNNREDDNDNDTMMWESLHTEPRASSPQQLAQDRKQQEANHVSENAVVTKLLNATTNNGVYSHHQDRRTSSSSSASFQRNHPPQDRRMERLRERLQAQECLRKSLVDHPMHLFWSQFVVHFGLELWQLDWKLRLALLLLIVGMATKMMLLSLFFVWYPQLILIPILIVLPLLYLHPDMVMTSIQSMLVVFSSPAAFAEALRGGLWWLDDPMQLRRACLAFLMLPTLLEMRTIHFLLHAGTTTSGGYCCWTWYNLLVATAVAATAVWLQCYSSSVVHNNLSPRECTHRAWLVLYASALVRVALARDYWNLPFLLAPFCSATGVLLWSCSSDDNDDWLSRAVRMALRKTLRDVLSNMSQNVQQDEMLQLAMLRWIVDYWSNTTTTSSGSSSCSSTTQTRRPSYNTHSSLFTGTTTLATRPQPEVQWTELLPMLSMTTDQMATEVETLQHRSNVSTPSTSSSSLRVNTTTRIDNSNNNQEPRRSASFSAATSASAPHSTSSPDAFTSIDNLQSMLASMDIDAHAKPAVEAYKRGIEAFPPPHCVAVLVSVARRCPALLLLILSLLLLSSTSNNDNNCLSSLLILVPLVVLELLRIQEWSDSCQNALLAKKKSMENKNNSSSKSPEDETSFWHGNADPMVLLLSGDRLSLNHQPPSLLVVWMNIYSSVSALQTGLTAARCVHTTAVAVDFCGNLLSLAHLGVQVSQRGWIYGLGVLFQEMIALHTMSGGGGGGGGGRRGNSSHDDSSRTRYTSAAMSAVTNSQKMSHNVKILMEEEDVGQFFLPILGALSVLVGRGWIWGKDEDEETSAAADARRHTPPPPQSTVEIEELDDSNDDDNHDTVVRRNDKEPEATTATREEAECEQHSSGTKDMLITSIGITKSTVESEELNDEGTVPRHDNTQIAAVPKEAGRLESGRTGTLGVPSVTSVSTGVGEIMTETNVFEVTLREKVMMENPPRGEDEQLEKWEDVTDEEESTALTKLSAIMDLVASCAERNLIEDSEKNLFFEKFATATVDNEADMVWIEGTRRTLEGLLSHSGKVETRDSNPPELSNLSRDDPDSKSSTLASTEKPELETIMVIAPVDGCKGSQDVQSPDEMKPSSSAGKQEPSAAIDLPIAGSAQAPSNRVVLPDVVVETVAECGSDGVAGSREGTESKSTPRGDETTLISSEKEVEGNSENPLGLQVDREEAVEMLEGVEKKVDLSTVNSTGGLLATRITSASFEASSPAHKHESPPPDYGVIDTDLGGNAVIQVEDDDDDFEPLVYASDSASATVLKNVARNDKDAEHSKPMPNKSESAASSDESNDMMWVQVGGGLAVLGAAVVGGVALAMRQQSGEGKPGHRRHGSKGKHRH